MHGILLTGRPDLEVNANIVAAAKRHDLELRVVDGCRAVARFSPAPSVVDEYGRPVPTPDLVLPRIGNWRPESLLSVLQMWLRGGAWSPNEPDAIRTARDHWRTVDRLTAAGLPAPASLAGGDPETLAAAARALGDSVVVKQRRSRQGVGVMLCTGADHLEAVLDSLWRVGDEVLVQEYLGGPAETARLLVVEGAVVAAARFRGRPGEWRSNAARGGAVEPYVPPGAETTLAVAAAGAVGLGLCGIDLAWRGSQPVVLDVNPSPGLRYLQKATREDVADALIRGLVHARRRRRHTDRP